MRKFTILGLVLVVVTFSVVGAFLMSAAARFAEYAGGML